MRYQCTYVDIGRAAQHMRQRAAETTDRVLARGFCDAADMLESEARRLQEQALSVGGETSVGRILARVR